MFSPHFQRISTKMHQALGLLYRHLFAHGLSDPRLSYVLFKQFVFGSINFGAAIWYPMITNGQRQALERVHLSFLRYCLGVPQRALSEIVYADMGAYPLEFYFKRQVLRFWNRLLELREDHPAHAIFQLLLSTHRGRTSWIVRVERIIQEYLPSFVGGTPVDIKQWCEAYKEAFSTTTFACENSTMSLFFRHFKTRIQFLGYLSSFPSKGLKSLYCRFRAGTHGLAVDTGRLNGVPRDERLCLICNEGVVEDEAHFLFRCPAYSQLRDQYSDVFAWYSLPFVLNNADQVRVAKMLKEFFTLRNSLTSSSRSL